MNLVTTAPCSEELSDVQKNGSLTSARIVLGELWRLLQPVSVIDIGCGVATWLKVAAELGARSIVGVDGDYVRRDRLLVDPTAFWTCNLEIESCRAALPDDLTFDLVMSLEVADQLPETRANSFVEELCTLGNLVLFSAAIPGQGRRNRINAQWPAYWGDLFKKNGFACFDILRPKIWEKSEIDWWYAQNVLLFARRETSAYETISRLGSPVSDPMPLVHPRMLAHVLGYQDARIAELEHLALINHIRRDDTVRALEDKVDALRSLVTSGDYELRNLELMGALASREQDLLPTYVVGSLIDFSKAAQSRCYMGTGWSKTETTGVWTDGPRAELWFRCEPKPVGALYARIRITPFLVEGFNQQVEVFVNGTRLCEWSFPILDESYPGWFDLTIPSHISACGKVTINFDIRNPISPKHFGVSEDQRSLGVMLHEMCLTHQPSNS